MQIASAANSSASDVHSPGGVGDAVLRSAAPCLPVSLDSIVGSVAMLVLQQVSMDVDETNVNLLNITTRT